VLVIQIIIVIVPSNNDMNLSLFRVELAHKYRLFSASFARVVSLVGSNKERVLKTKLLKTTA